MISHNDIQSGDQVLVAWDKFIDDTGRISLRCSRAYLEDRALVVRKLKTSGGFVDCLVSMPGSARTWIMGKYLHKIY